MTKCMYGMVLLNDLLGLWMETAMEAYEESRKLVIEAIENALVLHEKQDFFSIGCELDELEIQLYKQELPEGSLLLVAHEFLTGWADSAAHDWYHWEPMKKDDWPRLANVLLSDLRANQQVTNSELLTEFRVINKPNASIVSRILGLLHAKKTWQVQRVGWVSDSVTHHNYYFCTVDYGNT